MDNKIKKIVATGLIATMISTFSACDESKNIKPDLLTTTKQGDIISESPNNSTSNHPFASGSVWEAVKMRDNFYFQQNPYYVEDIAGLPLPITFLLEEGALYRDSWGNLKASDGQQKSSRHNPFACIAFVDANSPENDVYLIVQYQNNEILENQKNPDTYLATWQLKYTLDDNDYNAFLKLKGDWRECLFIQEMDRIYQPEVISKSIINIDLRNIGSHVRYEEEGKNGFPYIFVSNIDYNRQIITCGALFDEGIRYIDIDIRKSKAWQLAQTDWGLTEEECEDEIRMETTPTKVGNCLTEFTVYYLSGGLGNNQAKEMFENTENVAKLVQVDINNNKAQYSFEEISK